MKRDASIIGSCARMTVLYVCAASASSCNTSAFSRSLDGIQCFGLTLAPSALTLDACAAAACAIDAQMYEYCVLGSTCSSYAGPSCWVGSVPLASCVPAPSWTGRAQPDRPPSPPPPRQAFHAPSLTRPLAVLDLADESGHSWALAIDGGAPRTIGVPLGGYSSDAQALPWTAAADTRVGANYTRTFTVPTTWPTIMAVNKLSFGAVNHGGIIFLDNVLVGAHYGPMMPFDIPVGALVPGSTHVLTVTALPYAVLKLLAPSGFIYNEVWQPPTNGFASRACAGICRHVLLLALPAPLRVEALVTAARVGPPATLTALITVRNDGPTSTSDGAFTIAGAFSSAQDATWAYPSLPQTPIPALAPGAAATVAVEVAWALGPASWWWPNRPFSETYAPQLHWLNVTLQQSDGAALSTAARRFGFVEHSEGGAFYYTLNGVRINQLSDATPENAMSQYDAYTMNDAAFGSGGGARETWKRFMRLGLTSNRVHQSTPTPSMLDAADEVGFLLKPESPVRGNCDYTSCALNASGFQQSVQELVRATAGHACVAAFSVENESSGPLLGALIDAAVSAMGSAPVPLTIEGSGGARSYNGTTSGVVAVNYLHYAVPDDTRSHIRAVGECAWCVSDGLESFSSLALAGRINDVAYYAGWDLLNYWSNFLEGMNASRHAWTQKPCQGRDRTDGVDGWGSPLVEWIQRAFHPFLVVDTVTMLRNPIYSPTWPSVVESVASGGLLNRNVMLFNDVLADTFTPWSPAASALELTWRAVWDNPTGTVIVANDTIVLSSPPGFSVTTNVSFVIPLPGATTPRPLFIVLESTSPDGTPRYVEDRVYVLVHTHTNTIYVPSGY